MLNETLYSILAALTLCVAAATLINTLLAHQTIKENQKTLLHLLTLREQSINNTHEKIRSLQQSTNEFLNLHKKNQENLELKLSQSIEKNIRQIMQSSREQLFIQLRQHQSHTNDSLTALQKNIDAHLKSISGQVDQRLSKGFEKSHEVFGDVIKRLILIDKAQERIAELSTHVTDLQSVLTDKKSRGAFGETQLITLVRNVIPEKHFKLQATLSNGKRVDCLLTMPQPTGDIPIDAKFPLENYRNYIKAQNTTDKHKALTTFKQDVKKHIQDIADRYYIPGETSEGAIMYVPAEAVFAEIHAELTDVVEFAHSLKVWIASPTTMMAILNTALSVLKDQATRNHMDTMKYHLKMLSQDFGRFQKRMDKLANHIGQANDDVGQVHTSSKKLTQRFQDIESLKISAPSKEPSAELEV
ncbi:MAG TPA: DNA recombination protein RmuC [Gammaproteobacteria bacterium]|nr:DNA recombination protein RmuC [Gammaproteobacteria bacterium]